jgi:hypothetical protein
MAKMMPGGFAYGVDHVPELVELAQKNVSKSH